MPTQWENKSYYYVLYYKDEQLVVQTYDAETLERGLSEKWFGERRIMAALPKQMHPVIWGNSLVIIKGSIVFPEAVEVVTKYKLP